MIRSILILFLAFNLSSCYESDESEQDAQQSTQVRSYAGVDERLWPYFSNFEREAAERNIRVDLTLTNITGAIEEIHEDGVAGSCSYGGRQRTNDVTVDSEFWNRANVFYREYIVFHELGHCFLFRDHDDACLSNRTWESIMRSGTTRTCRDNYNSQTREYYLDELFGLTGN